MIYRTFIENRNNHFSHQHKYKQRKTIVLVAFITIMKMQNLILNVILNVNQAQDFLPCLPPVISPTDLKQSKSWTYNSILFNSLKLYFPLKLSMLFSAYSKLSSSDGSSCSYSWYRLLILKKNPIKPMD